MMSIESLEKMLQQTLALSRTAHNQDIVLVQPLGLQKQLAILEARYDNPKEAVLDKEKTLIAILLLESRGVPALTLRDWKYIAWGLSVHYSSRPQKLIFNTPLCNQILTHFEGVFSNTVNRSIWWALLFSYFALEKSEKEKYPPSWVKLRHLLSNSFSQLYSETSKPRDWMLVLKEYPELLMESPTKKLAVQILTQKQDKLSLIRGNLNIAPSSWFFSDLIAEQLKYVSTLDDAGFKQNIDKILLLGQEHPAYLSQILQSLLDRYALSKMRQDIHESLKKIALETWGSPQFNNTASWALVKKETKEMVLQWFVRADLEAFFSLLQDDHNSDKRRLKYWMRFINQISYTRLVLGGTAFSSRGLNFVKFRNDNKGRFSRLTGGTHSNNAFIIKIGNYFIIEFSETGNACFIFRNSPVNLSGDSYRLSELKDSSYIEKISHSSNWESKLDQVLMGLGVYPKNHY